MTVAAPHRAPVERLDRDRPATVRLAGAAEIRALVDLYYAVQELRKSTANQADALTMSRCVSIPAAITGSTPSTWRDVTDGE